MKASANQILPSARTRELIVRELEDEVLVYDLERQKAHCLNQTSAFVWKHCDGRTSIAKMVQLLEKRLKTPVSEQVVWLALEQLEKSHLLKKTVMRQSQQGKQMSRRELVRRLGTAAAVTIPLVISIAAPTSAAAASGCVGNGGVCTTNADCCVGLMCLNCGAGLMCFRNCP